MDLKKRILVAPLNWGLGHATRCIPIINALLKQDYVPILASDGMALRLLKKEFPKLDAFELPYYDISYPKKAKQFKIKLLKNTTKILKAIKTEHEETQNLIDQYNIDGIISDNRLGVYSKKVHSVFVTHQLNVLSGNTTWLSTQMHNYYLKKFDECWVPDIENEPNLSGKLGHLKQPIIPTSYLGPISRFKKEKLPLQYDLLVLLSGPEPQRSMLEEKLLLELKNYQGKILFVKGLVEPIQTKEVHDHITVVNFLTTKDLQDALNSSDLILSRSGYTTILDLAKLGKKAFFIPTPGQYEQQYLAKRLDKAGLIPYCAQDEFSLDQLNKLDKYKGFEAMKGDESEFPFYSAFSSVKENSLPTPNSLST